jgi:acetyl esterase/lipase
MNHLLSPRVWTLAIAMCLQAAPSIAQTIPTNGLYANLVYPTTSIAKVLNVPYSTRANPLHQHFTTSLRKAEELAQDTLTLELDIYLPPNASANSPQPLVIWTHSGNLVKGAKEEVTDKLTSYSRAGYVAAAINYRMNYRAAKTEADSAAAHTRASEDVSNAVRFLRQNANTYFIDPSRVALMGISAGGVLAMMGATDPDTLAGAVNDFPGLTARTEAVVSTGATLVGAGFNAFTMLTADPTDTNVQMFHANPVDNSTHATWDGNAVPTCMWIASTGNTCELNAQPDMTHTVNLNVGPSIYWPLVRAFLWPRLRLDELRPN